MNERQSPPSTRALLLRIATALERLAPKRRALDADGADVFLWNPAQSQLQAVRDPDRASLSLLKGIDRQRDILHANTLHFARGLAANNALLWGARGMGKSSLIKAAHADVNAKMEEGRKIALVEILNRHLATLAELMAALCGCGRRCILFCDDLSFAGGDYQDFKAVLEGGVAAVPANVVVYATSNRRHVVARRADGAGDVHRQDEDSEQLALSDRFGLWLGFHPCSQEQWYVMLEAHARARGLKVESSVLRREGDAWALARGGRSGRVAAQFVLHLAASL